MNKLSKEKKQQIILVLMGTAIVVAALWYLVIQNQYASLDALQKKTADMKSKVSTAENLLKKADQIEAELEEDVKQLESIEGAMASGDIYLWFINTINQFNNTRRLTFLDFQREIIGEVGMVPKFPYQAAIYPVKGTGYYHDIGRFLADFENSFPHMRVQNLELQPADKSVGESGEKLSFKFEIVSLIKPTS